ncbi:MAG: hypothetical protein KIT84_23585 [Labilithrix sp.]|nr:hypothetical protein [Labilithrix sp.]MCW5814031.1 hypothetical protein [Labilithrix sp.]
MGRRWLARALMIVAVAACTSPTLPLPPPALPTISAGTEPNSYTLRSERGAIPNALLVAVSRNETLLPEERVNGTIANAEGTWEMTVKGQPQDVIDLTQDSGTGTSPSIAITLPAR